MVNGTDQYDSKNKDEIKMNKANEDQLGNTKKGFISKKNWRRGKTCISYMRQDSVSEWQIKEMKENSTYTSDLNDIQPKTVSNIGSGTKPRPTNTLTIIRFSANNRHLNKIMIVQFN